MLPVAVSHIRPAPKADLFGTCYFRGSSVGPVICLVGGNKPRQVARLPVWYTMVESGSALGQRGPRSLAPVAPATTLVTKAANGQKRAVSCSVRKNEIDRPETRLADFSLI